MRRGKTTPKTTYADVIVAGYHFNKYLNAGSFVRSSGFLAAKSKLQATMPSPWDMSNPFAVYPRNDAFWHAALTMAVERSAAGEIPHWQDIALESVAEAIDEAPDLIKKALSKVNPANLIPAASLMVNLLKWGTVAGGLYLLYSVLKPGKSK